MNGTVDVDVTMRDYADGVTPESIDASGRVDMSHSTIGGIDIDTAVVNGMYQDRSGNSDASWLSMVPTFTSKGRGRSR